MTDSVEVIDPADNPALANAQIAAVLADAPEEVPSIDPPAEVFLTLPGGYVRDDGSVVRDIEVQELSGTHEERIVRARLSGDQSRFLQTLLECGVVSIGGKEATSKALEDLLVGDREYAALAIRNATYGPEIDYGHSTCPECREEVDIVVRLSEIPVRALKQREFEVKLRKGGKADVRLPNGADQSLYLADEEMNDAERNSLLLSRCVRRLTEKNGTEHLTAGFPSLVRDSLGIVDRKAIIDAINENQPGPLYDEVEYEHECGFKMHLPVGLMHLFPGL